MPDGLADLLRALHLLLFMWHLLLFMGNTPSHSVPQSVLDSLATPADIVRPTPGGGPAAATMPLVHPEDFQGSAVPTACSPSFPCWYGCGSKPLAGSIGATCDSAHQKILGWYGGIATANKANPAIVTEAVTEVLYAIAATDVYFFYVNSEDGQHAELIANSEFGEAPKGAALPQRLGSPPRRRDAHVRMVWTAYGLRLTFSGAVGPLMGKLGAPSVGADGVPTWPDVDPAARKAAHAALVTLGDGDLLGAFNTRLPVRKEEGGGDPKQPIYVRSSPSPPPCPGPT